MSRPRVRKVTYYTYIRWVEANGEALTMQTQRYDIGIYCVISQGNLHDQWGSEPGPLSKGQQRMIEGFKKRKIKYELGPTISVEKIDGFWKESI